MSTEMYEGITFIDERQSGDPGFLGRLALRPYNGYVPQELSLPSASTRQVSSARPTRHGSDDSTSLFGSRAVGLTVAILPDAVPGATENDLVEQLEAWMDPSLRFRMTLANGRSLLVRGDSLDSDWNFTELEYHMVRLTMVAPDGAKESTELQSKTGSFALSGDIMPGRSYPLTYNRVYPIPGADIGSSAVSCTNEGRMIAYPMLRFEGQLDNPGAVNVETGQRFQIDVVLAATDVLTVDMLKHRVYFNGEQAYYQKIDFTGDPWWGLLPRRNNRIRFIADSYGTGSAAVPGSNAYLNPAVGTASTPDTTPDALTGLDFTVIARVKLGAMAATPTAKVIATQRLASTQLSWSFLTTANRGISFHVSSNGTSMIATTDIGSIPGGYVAGQVVTLAASVDVDNGAAGHTITTRILGADGVTWSTINSRTTAGVLTLFNSTAAIMIGGQPGGTPALYDSNIESVEVRQGLDPTLPGTLIWRFDPSQYVSGTSFTSSGRTWTTTAAAAVVKAVAANPGTIGARGTVEWRHRWP